MKLTKEERAAKRAAKAAAKASSTARADDGDDDDDGDGDGDDDDASRREILDAASAVTVRFPPALTPRQRACLHALAESCGIAHRSSGEDATRRIALGAGAVDVIVDASDLVAASASADDDDDDDAALRRVLTTHLKIPDALARGHFAAGPPARATSTSTSTRRAPPPPPSSSSDVELDAWLAKTKTLMTLERDAEVEQSEGALREMSPATAAKRGRALLGLKIVDARGGLLGKTVLTFESSKRPTAAAPPLPPHKFTPHDVVCVRPSKGVGGGEPIAAGVVYRVKDTAIEVAVDDAPDSDGVDQAVRLEKLSNETTHKRLRAALERLGSAPRGGGGAASGSGPGGGGAYGRVVDVMFGKTPPRFAKRDAADDGFARFFNPRLDASQKDAVAHALRAVDLALIHGPPGTGKTTVVVEYVAREVARGARILCCAASNVAVDNLVERLARVGSSGNASGNGNGGKLLGGISPKITRLGHPARLLASVLENSLEAQVLRSDNSSLARDCERESAALRRRLLKLADAKTREDRAERGDARRELRRLAKETRARQRLAVDEVVASANVVCCTLAGALGGVLKDQTFDVVVIDEAAQALEASCWGAIMRGGKVVLAGDHLQLPPTVLSDVAAREGLSETLFQRAHAKWYRENVAVMLTTQYRMHEDIMSWASNAMYDGALLASEDARGRTLRSASGAPLGALQLVDTAGCDCDERQEEEGASRDNPGEAAVAMRIVADLISSGAVAADDVGIITPYSAQVGTLRDLRAANDALFKGVEISTVDGFQGREKEAIVISAVRSNDRGDVGFLSDARRMNVAVTRARARCVLVCDTETIARKDAFLAGLVKHFETRGEYISAAELQED